jgi:hypothetical protein
MTPCPGTRRQALGHQASLAGVGAGGASLAHPRARLYLHTCLACLYPYPGPDPFLCLYPYLCPCLGHFYPGHSCYGHGHSSPCPESGTASVTCHACGHSCPCHSCPAPHPVAVRGGLRERDLPHQHPLLLRLLLLTAPHLSAWHSPAARSQFTDRTVRKQRHIRNNIILLHLKTKSGTASMMAGQLQSVQTVNACCMIPELKPNQCCSLVHVSCMDITAAEWSTYLCVGQC